MYAYKKEKPIVAFKFVALGDESGGDNFAELSADVESAGGTCERSERAGGPVVVVKYDWKEVTLPLGHYVVFDGTGMGVVLTAQALTATRKRWWTERASTSTSYLQTLLH